MAHRRVRNRSAMARRAPTRIAKQTGPPGTPLRRSHRETRGAEGYKQQQPYRGLLKFWSHEVRMLNKIDKKFRAGKRAKAQREQPKS